MLRPIRRRGGRVAEGAGLLNRYTGFTPYRGFESPPLRFKGRLGFGLVSLVRFCPFFRGITAGSDEARRRLVDRDRPVRPNRRQSLWRPVCDCRFQHRYAARMSTCMYIRIPPTPIPRPERVPRRGFVMKSASSSRKVERLLSGQTRECPVVRNWQQVLWGAVCDCRFPRLRARG